MEGEQKQALLSAAASTLDSKMSAGGGHTSWSAGWAACLWARLRQPEKAAALLEKVSELYTADNLFSLHPPLIPSKSKEAAGCKTCYTEDAAHLKQRRVARTQRGLMTADESKVQFDGSMAFVAAVNELLVQVALLVFRLFEFSLSCLNAIPPHTRTPFLSFPFFSFPSLSFHFLSSFSPSMVTSEPRPWPPAPSAEPAAVDGTRRRA